MLKSEINRAARAVAAMVVSPTKPFTVPIGSLAKIPMEGKMSTRKRYAIGVGKTIAQILLKHPSGISANQIHVELVKQLPNWKLQNTYGNLTRVKDKGAAKNLNRLWYPGDNTAALAENPKVHFEPRKPRPHQVKANGSEPVIMGAGDADESADRLIDGAIAHLMDAAMGLKSLKELLANQAEKRNLATAQNRSRLDAILKLVADQGVSL